MAKTKIIPAIMAFIAICKMTGPIKLVSVTKNVISIYMAKISTGWIKPVTTAFVNLIFAVAQNTNVLKPYIKTQPNNNEFKKMSTSNILVMIPPRIMMTHNMVMDSVDKNMECLILTLIPSRMLITCWLRAPLMIEGMPITSNAYNPP